MLSSDLHEQKCIACEGIGQALNLEQVEELKKQIDESWEIREKNTQIMKTFQFKNYYQTMAFVNALAWIAHRENHHPDLQVSYNRCEVTWSTHALKGLSMNDFICAAKTDKLMQNT
jgi:4a-hydroxytetrahydrobiopterin dehydratase